MKISTVSPEGSKQMIFPGKGIGQASRDEQERSHDTVTTPADVHVEVVLPDDRALDLSREAQQAQNRAAQPGDRFRVGQYQSLVCPVELNEKGQPQNGDQRISGRAL